MGTLLISSQTIVHRAQLCYSIKYQNSNLNSVISHKSDPFPSDCLYISPGATSQKNKPLALGKPAARASTQPPPVQSQHIKQPASHPPCPKSTTFTKRAIATGKI